ncbi:hypothetical protein Aph01nite_35020 [Acrocarpospora phusangensis]|uniref:Uncharacterized protein n=1 Tax=Acrocarpospora phusangensis TaxID=1070424 RepID=A0A919QA74_9ACTN|nr:hypothetical protein [Acrocarpospora phusangensis]GIH25192.1 hypothetical protein Aph01nite_35020 [Acrocarpospora phusangensis]
MRTPEDLEPRTAVRRADRGICVPISVSRTRFKLLVFALLAVVSSLSDSPEWLTLALILTCAAIPLALGALGGAEAVRALFLLPPRPVPPDTIRKDDLI